MHPELYMRLELVWLKTIENSLASYIQFSKAEAGCLKLLSYYNFYNFFYCKWVRWDKVAEELDMPCAVLQREVAGLGSCCSAISEGQLVIKDRSHAFIAPGADDCVTFNRDGK